MIKNILIIFNPVAGHKYPKYFKKNVLRLVKKYLPITNFEWLETLPNLSKQLKEANLVQFDRLIVIGGDGTIKAIANFLLQNNFDIPLAIIPQGSANILASSLDVPLITNLAIKTACKGVHKKMDVGLLNNEQYFLICLSIGFWSKVVHETKRGLKIKLGFLAYLVTYFKQKKIKHTTYKFKVDGKHYQMQGNTFVIANTMSLFKIKPKRPIDFFDGLFDIITVSNSSFWGFLLMGIFAIFNQRFVPFLKMYQGKKITICPPPDTVQKIQIDGEIFKSKKIEVEIIPQKLSIITRALKH